MFSEFVFIGGPCFLTRHSWPSEKIGQKNSDPKLNDGNTYVVGGFNPVEKY